LPVGLTLSNSGVLSGTPTTAGGPFNVIFNVTDFLGVIATANISIPILPQLTIPSTSPLPAGAVNAPYLQTLTFNGGLAPYTWAIQTGILPAGLSLSAAGIISGTPVTAGGPVNIVVNVHDILGVTATRTFSLTIYPAGYFAGQVMIITGHSPIDIEVTDPDGLKITKHINQIPGATYQEIDLDNDGELEDQIIIPDRKIGQYRIVVVAQSGALPSDTYSLDVSIGGTNLVIAENIRVDRIPYSVYGVDSTETGIIRHVFSVPGLSIWGTAGLIVFLCGTIIWVLRNRKEKTKI
jgi:hypothetical protein